MHLLVRARKEFLLTRAVCTRECTHTAHTVSSPWKSTRDQDTPGVAINTRLIERGLSKIFLSIFQILLIRMVNDIRVMDITSDNCAKKIIRIIRMILLELNSKVFFSLLFNKNRVTRNY